MSILIKGMEMPTSCYFCPMTNDGFYLCKANNPYRQLEDDCEEHRPSWCPIVELPTHGDLIDRDEQIERAWRLNLSTRELIEEMLKTAPTVIPADKEENET